MYHKVWYMWYIWQSVVQCTTNVGYKKLKHNSKVTSEKILCSDWLILKAYICLHSPRLSEYPFNY